MDDRPPDARLLRLVPDALERRHGSARSSSQFRLDVGQKASHLSKGQRTQVALIAAICPEPDLLVLDEPTSGLDPIVRREFIQTVIGAYQDGDPGRRTVFVSTHLISEFEGLIDEFTIIDRGKDVLTLDADTARERYQKIHARFAGDPAGARPRRRARAARTRAAIWRSSSTATRRACCRRCARARPKSLTTEALTLEEIFVSTLQPAGSSRMTARAHGASAWPGEGNPCALPDLRACISVAVVAGSFGNELHPDRHRTPGLCLRLGGARRPVVRPRVQQPHARPAACRSPPIGAGCIVYKLGVLSVMLVTLAAVTLLLFRDVLSRAVSPAHRTVDARPGGCVRALHRTVPDAASAAARSPPSSSPSPSRASWPRRRHRRRTDLRPSECRRPSTGSSSRSSGAACSSSAQCPRSPAGWMFTPPRGDRGPRRTFSFRTSCAPARRRPPDRQPGGTIPSRALIRKDLRLQQMAFVGRCPLRRFVAAFAWMDSRAIDKPIGLLIPLTLLYGGLARDPHRRAGERRGAAARNAGVADAAAEPGLAAVGGQGRRHVRARAAARRRAARPAARIPSQAAKTTRDCGCGSVSDRSSCC